MKRSHIFEPKNLTIYNNYVEKVNLPYTNFRTNVFLRFCSQGLQINEIDFLKMFMDYCLKLLKVPGQDLCSMAFNGS